MMEFVCLECLTMIHCRRAFNRHLTIVHDMSFIEHYVKHSTSDGIWPSCACGCGARVGYREKNGTVCFNMILRNHHTPEMREQRSKSCSNFYSTPKGQKISQERGKALTDFYASEQGQIVIDAANQKREAWYMSPESDDWRKKSSEAGRHNGSSKERIQKLRDFNISPAGQKKNKRVSERMIEFWSSAEGQQTKETVSGKLLAWYQTPAGIQKKEMQAKLMNELYASVEGEELIERRRTSTCLEITEVFKRLGPALKRVELLTEVNEDVYRSRKMLVDVRCHSCHAEQKRSLVSLFHCPRCLACEPIDPEWIKRASLLAAERLRTGKGFVVGEFFGEKLGRSVFYRSSWEHVVMQWCEHDKSVITYDYEPFIVPYNGGRKHYVPDFLIELVTGERLLVEVKPQKLVDNEHVIKKLLAGELFAEERKLKFVVWSETKINELRSLINF